MANKYEVLEGKHREPTGPRQFNEYVKGDFLESDRRLDKIFPCKFKDHGAVPKKKRAAKPAAKPAATTAPDPAPEPEASEPEATETETTVAAGTDGDGWENEKD